MSFLANKFNLFLKKIDNQNLLFESEVGDCWIGLSLVTDCEFMPLQLSKGHQFQQSQLFDLIGDFFTNNIKQS
ncbi:MAG: hypothetical protein KME30_19565 [Iphinoe sp. HA4291-MV1]|jgi:hypothetical protein|nr:hypothetical protein [Iphinoe sp. HA4291-MV1]